MRVTYTLAAGALWAALSTAGAAQAGGHGSHPMFRPHGLPPISGTIRLSRGAFGSGAFSHAGGGWSRDRVESYRRPSFVPHRSYGPALGYQGHAYRQLARSARGLRYVYAYGSYESAYRTAPSRPWWQGDGSGLVGLVGNEGYAYDGVGTGWGTADSATTGDAYPQRRVWHYETSRRLEAEAPLEIAYGEPDLWSGAGSRTPAAGGLAYYSSGSPGRLASYSSGSSAYGSTGGLGIYSSGSYGHSKIIRVSPHHVNARFSHAACACGPHIIHVGHDRRTARW